MASLLLAIAVTFFLILVSAYAFQLITTALHRLPPGPLPLPLVGNLLKIGGGNSPHRSLSRLAERHGSLMSIWLGAVHTVVVSSDDAAREILQRHNADLADRPVIDVWLANGHKDNSIISLPPHAKWRALRKFCTTELFTPSRLNMLKPLRQKKVQELLRYVSDRAAAGEPIAIRDPTITASMNMLSSTFFSVDLDLGPSVGGLVDMVKEATALTAAPNVSDFFPAIALADLQGLRRRMAPLVARAYQIIHQQFVQRLCVREAGDPSKNDMLDAVLDKEPEWKHKGSKIDRNAIVGMFTDLFVAGTDSSSTAVEWAMAELVQNPKVMKKAKEELSRVIGVRTRVDESDIAQLPYLQAVVKEVFRLHPRIALTFYRAEATVEVQGYIIPEGTTTILNIWAVHRNASIWAEPDKFFPERFMERDIGFLDRECKFIPFGGGRRTCLGQPLAYRTVHLILAELLYQFDWILSHEATKNGIDMTEKFGLVVPMATPLKLIAKRA